MTANVVIRAEVHAERSWRPKRRLLRCFSFRAKLSDIDEVTDDESPIVPSATSTMESENDDGRLDNARSGDEWDSFFEQLRTTGEATESPV